ncbi:MAG: ABC transporter permease [Planctomycetes bacterium]|nr:ABC transporter permease [Planctomycetota bacterium]
MSAPASAIRAVAWPLLGVAIVLGVWQIGVMVSGVAHYLLPPPSAIARAMWESRDMLTAAMGRTALGAAIGFICAAAAGILLGSVIALIPLLRRSLYPLATVLQMVPVVAVAPLLQLWVDNGLPMAILSAAIVALFPVLAATIDGQASVDPGLRELFKLYGASPLRRWWKLDFPWSVPATVTGLRIAAGLAVIGAVVGEFVSGYGGTRAPLGIVIQAAMRDARTDLVFAAVALTTVVGFALFGAISFVGWLLVSRWHASAVNESEDQR